jgi:hypothetical protein
MDEDIYTWTRQYSITEGHRNFRTSFKSRDDYCNNMGSYGKSRGGDNGQDNVTTPEVHQGGGDVNPLPT